MITFKRELEQIARKITIEQPGRKTDTVAYLFMYSFAVLVDKKSVPSGL